MAEASQRKHAHSMQRPRHHLYMHQPAKPCIELQGRVWRRLTVPASAILAQLRSVLSRMFLDLQPAWLSELASRHMLRLEAHCSIIDQAFPGHLSSAQAEQISTRDLCIISSS